MAEYICEGWRWILGRLSKGTSNVEISPSQMHQEEGKISTRVMVYRCGTFSASLMQY